MLARSARLAWTITGLAALLLLAATAALGMRERSLGQPAQSPETPLPVVSSEGTPASIQDLPHDARNGLIAFVSDRDGNDEIYVMLPNGNEQVRITDHPALDGDPVWSADGSRLAWIRYEDANQNGQLGDASDRWGLMIARPDGSGQQELSGGEGWLLSGGATTDLRLVALSVASDGNDNDELDAEDPRQLLLLDTATGSLNELLAQEEALLSSRQDLAEILFSPDGQDLLVLLTVDGDEGLYRLPLDGTEPTLVAEGRFLQMALSPDGQQLALWKETEDSGRFRMRMTLHDLESGRETTLLMGGLGLRQASDLQWSRDGTRLLFMGSTGNSAPEIYSLDVASDELLSLTGQVADPAFMPSWSPDGLQAVFVAQSFRSSGGTFVPAGDANIFLVDDLGGSITQITRDQGNNSQPAWQPVF